MADDKSAPEDHEIEGPPLSPDGEAIAHNPAFAAECLATVREFGFDETRRLEASCLTYSERWGFVYRVDFVIAGYEAETRINRIVCSRTSKGEWVIETAIGQQIPPLENYFGTKER